MKRRVVVTGIGCVTPIGISYDEVKDAMFSGRSGIRYYENIKANLGRVEFDIDSQIKAIGWKDLVKVKSFS